MKKILIVFVLLLVMQVFRIDKTNPEVIAANDFITITQPDAEIATLLKAACYNCHSNTTVYPWYGDIAPASWFAKHHVDEAREHLNFSEWGTYSDEDKEHKLHECYEEVEEGEMPLNSYTWLHPEANLSKEQRETLKHWFENFGPFEDEDEDEH